MRTIAVLMLVLALPLRAEEPLQIAVAANFRKTLETLQQDFSARSGVTLKLSSAATGVLHSQIRYGAPFDILLAADRHSAADLEARGAGVSGSRFCYARGRLELVGADSPDALADPHRSLAIANPATAPYGRAAQALLQNEAFAAGAKRKLILGSNAVQTLQFWHSGAVDMALVPRAMARGTSIPASWHPPIEQHALLLTRAADTSAARDFMNWLRSETVQAMILAAGYDSCL